MFLNQKSESRAEDPEFLTHDSSFLLSPGVTLIELLIVIMIIGLLATAALKAYDTSLQAGRYQSTMRSLREISAAVVGNPDLVSAGIRTDFGYVGDVGEPPDKLSDLVTQPANLDSGLWKGPYLINRVAESPNRYQYDAWGDSLIYSPESLTISSRRGMSILQPDSWITLRMVQKPDDVDHDSVQGIVYDSKGNAWDPAQSPGETLNVILAYPKLVGSRSVIYYDSQPNLQTSNFRFPGSVPIGNHLLKVMLIESAPRDTSVVTKNVSVAPGQSRTNWVEVHMPVPFK